MARKKGAAEAGVLLDRQPDDCARDTPHAALRLGDDARSALKRERAQLDAANDKRRDCYAFNENQRKGLTGG